MAGPNQRRTFYSCARAERGLSQQSRGYLRNCGYFMWSSDYDRQLKRKRETQSEG